MSFQKVKKTAGVCVKDHEMKQYIPTSWIFIVWTLGTKLMPILKYVFDCNIWNLGFKFSS